MAAPRQRIIILAVALAVAIGCTFFFGYRIGRYARHNGWQAEQVRPWMSVPFIAHTHHVSAETLYHAIDIQPHEHDRRPIRELAREKKRPVSDVIHDLNAAIENARHASPSKNPPASKGP